MDETVNDFLKEINEIVPQNSNVSKKDKEYDWKKCYDDSSGFSYYWNIKTDEVTWEVPVEYEDSLGKKPKWKKSTSLIGPTIPEDVKIYRISEENTKIVKGPPINCNKSKKEISQKISELELPALVSSYGSGTESDEEEKLHKNLKLTSANEDKLLETSSNVNAMETADNTNKVMPILSKSKLSGFSLVAGYGGESDEEEDETDKNTNCSPLFPIVEPLDINQFSETNYVDNTSTEAEQVEKVDIKAFQRKRRIDVPLINPIVKKKNNEIISEVIKEENLIESTDVKQINSIVQYPGFRSGGILFGDTKEETKDEANDLRNTIDNNKSLNEDDLKENITKNKDNLKEKLSFLNEGREPATAVQTMLIQMETLHDAFQSGDLAPMYLSKWLDNMSSELIKLEQEATPAGWLLHWDRSQKRYFYCNIETGQTQWQYPEMDVHNGSDDAMDISTTPPPPEEADKILILEPPPPPRITRASTPPPPIISSTEDEVTEPAPALIDKSQGKANNDSMTSALNSFYSDIAAIENGQEKLEAPELTKNSSSTTNTKKKKTKVKLSQGLSMKKKGVSKLVEKWKNLQQNYD